MSAVLSAALSKVSPEMGLFQTLFVYEAKGFFFLRHALNDHTTVEGLSSIMKKAMALYDASLSVDLPVFTPCFKFKEVDGKICMTMRRCPCMGYEDLTIAEINLAVVQDPGAAWNKNLVLEESVLEPELF